MTHILQATSQAGTSRTDSANTCSGRNRLKTLCAESFVALQMKHRGNSVSRTHCLPTAHLLAARVEKDKSWVGNWILKAIALALAIDIIVVSTNSMLLFTKGPGHNGRHW